MIDQLPWLGPRWDKEPSQPRTVVERFTILRIGEEYFAVCRCPSEQLTYLVEDHKKVELKKVALRMWEVGGP